MPKTVKVQKLGAWKIGSWNQKCYKFLASAQDHFEIKYYKNVKIAPFQALIRKMFQNEVGGGSALRMEALEAEAGFADGGKAARKGGGEN